MTDPGEWLTSKLDEVEALVEGAKACGESWTHNRHGGDPWLITGGEAGSAYSTKVVVYDEGAPNDGQAAHIAFCDPAMVLQLVAGMRQLLELHERRSLQFVVHRGIDKPLGKGSRLVCWHCDDGYQQPVDWPCDTVVELARAWGFPVES